LQYSQNLGPEHKIMQGYDGVKVFYC